MGKLGSEVTTIEKQVKTKILIKEVNVKPL